MDFRNVFYQSCVSRGESIERMRVLVFYKQDITCSLPYKLQLHALAHAKKLSKFLKASKSYKIMNAKLRKGNRKEI